MSDCDFGPAPSTTRRWCYTHRCWFDTGGDTCPLADAQAEIEVLREALSGLGERVFVAENALATVRSALRTVESIRALDGGMASSAAITTTTPRRTTMSERRPHWDVDRWTLVSVDSSSQWNAGARFWVKAEPAPQADQTVEDDDE